MNNKTQRNYNIKLEDQSKTKKDRNSVLNINIFFNNL